MPAFLKVLKNIWEKYCASGVTPDADASIISVFKSGLNHTDGISSHSISFTSLASYQKHGIQEQRVETITGLVK